MKDLLFSILLPYLLRMLLVSGLFYGYYWLFLRDKVFHQYNRFYLLGASIAAMILPLIRVQLPAAIPPIGGAPALVLHAIATGNWNEAAGPYGVAVNPGAGPRSAVMLVACLYCLVAFISLLAFLLQLSHIRRLPGKYPVERLGPIDFYMTREPGTPFSFLHRLFWNAEIDIDSPRGRQIFLHELSHIRERHTLDLLWLRTVMIFFWINPFFYLTYREIRTIHEYLADRHAASGADRYDYAEMLLWQTITDGSLSLLHPFFQSSIKRRITMLTRFQVTKPGCISRLIALPLTFLLLCAFAARKPQTGGPALFTVIIDAGHGGADNGAVWGDTKEKDLNLALALAVRRLAPQYHINAVLTRKSDELAGGHLTIRQSLEYRVTMARDSKADLFVSLHVNNSGGGKPGHGFEAFVSPENAHLAESDKLASALIDAVKPSFAADDVLHHPTGRVYVLREAAMPAVLLECGSIDNPADLAFIRDTRNQEQIARDILQGIQRYRESRAAGK
ncbi:MAG TPA: N-acetylmuramoyl-L-alanine amidase [Puia sp.]|nr:N-acetylmuramoyl-L-alanine amidase [Puia sp.]